MKVFPVDSVVEKLDDDGIPIYDRPYTSSDIRSVTGRFFKNGVFLDKPDNLQVYQSTGGMNVLVRPGGCIINGAVGIETAQRNIPIEVASGDYDRIDTVVLRLDLNVASRLCDIFVKKGTPAAVPVVPSLERNDTIYELGIANIRVEKNSKAVPAKSIFDTRLDSSRCGVATPYANIDTTHLFDLLRQATDDAVNAYKNALDGTIAGNLQTYRKSIRVEQEILSTDNLNNYRKPGNYGMTVFSVKDAQKQNFPSALKEPFVMYVSSVNDIVTQEILPQSGGSFIRTTLKQGFSDWAKRSYSDSEIKGGMEHRLQIHNVYSIGDSGVQLLFSNDQLAKSFNPPIDPKTFSPIEVQATAYDSDSTAVVTSPYVVTSGANWYIATSTRGMIRVTTTFKYPGKTLK